jgi:hypothetical protein
VGHTINAVLGLPEGDVAIWQGPLLEGELGQTTGTKMPARSSSTAAIGITHRRLGQSGKRPAASPSGELNRTGHRAHGTGHGLQPLPGMHCRLSAPRTAR